MIETHIVQNRHLGREQCNRSIAFIDFADEDIALPYPRTGKGGIISNEIFHHCAVHDGRITAGVRQYPSDHAGYRRFSARSTHRNAARCGVEQVCEQFGACHTGTAKCIGLGDIRNAVLNSCRGNEDLVTADDTAAILRKQVNAKALEPFEFRSQPALIQRAVRSGNSRACIANDVRQRQHARSTNATEEIGFVFVHQWRLWPEDDFGNGSV